MTNRIQHRRDTAANWTSANPVLSAGEPAFETDTGKQKIGDGSTAWVSLAYTSGATGATGATGPQGPTGPAGASAASLIPVYRNQTFEVQPYQTVTGSARCPAGYILSGGYQFSQVTASQVFVSQNMPTSTTEWAVTGYNMNGVTAVFTIWYLCTQ